VVASPDLDGDLWVSVADSLTMGNVLMGQTDPTGDLNCDGIVTVADLDLLSASSGDSCLAAVGVPDPSRSTVPCLAICPEGEFAFEVTVRDIEGTALPGTKIVVDLSGCSSYEYCAREGSDPHTFEEVSRAVGYADAGGSFVFPIRGGGVCADSVVSIWADDVLLAQRSLTSCDLNGDLIVDDSDYFLLSPKIDMDCSSYDLIADFNCDGYSDQTDEFDWWLHYDGAHSCLTGVDVSPGHGPTVFRLHPTFPNPAQGGSVLRFDIPVMTEVSLKLYDVRGRIVRHALNRAPTQPGRHQWSWDGLDDSGFTAPPGVYFYVLETPQYRSAKSVVILAVNPGPLWLDV
jgi:hypothetical protein